MDSLFFLMYLFQFGGKPFPDSRVIFSFSTTRIVAKWQQH